MVRTYPPRISVRSVGTRALLALPTAPRETLQRLEFVMDTMAQHRPQDAGAGKPERLEVREAGPISLGRRSHPDDEETSLHDAPPWPENGPCPQAQSER